MNNPKKVLGIIGSPRKGGNTEIITDSILKGAREAGALIEKVRLTDLNISPCLACESCADTRICVQKDDMPALLKKMKESDVWIMGTPVYYQGPTAQFKAFQDRWFGAQPIFEGRPVVLVIPLGDTDKKAAGHTAGYLQNSLSYVRAKVISTIVAPGVYAPGDVLKFPELLEKAYQIGRDAVM